MSRRASVAVASLLSTTFAFGQATDSSQLEEIIVTAQKREQSLQDVPISLMVLGSEQLEQLNIRRFDDYLLYLPSVSAQSAGPSQSQIYMRGVSDGGDGNFSGTSPSVAVYLNEQPVTSIGRNLDVHIYDIARIEAVAGPQGTLYGSSSQAGTIRILTNQPNTEGFEAGYDLGVNSTSGGDEGYSVEGFVNIPLSDRAAIRLVGWSVEEGGWIDNIAGSNTYRSGIMVSNTGNSDTNKNTVEEDANSLTSTGLRALLGIDLNDSWTLDASVNFQEQESDGVFADQPSTAGEGNIVRFFQDEHKDEWTQLGLTLNGDLGFGNLTLAGSYLDREVQYDIDYSEYTNYSTYIELYYTCDYGTYDNCVDPRIQYNQDSEYKRSTIEARLQSSGDSRLNWVAGLFYEKNEHTYFNQWHIPPIDGSVRGFFGDAGIAGPIDPSLFNVRGESDLYFATNQERTVEQTAFFGEISYDFTDKFTGLVGARFFNQQDELSGFVGSYFYVFNSSDCIAAGVMNNVPRNPRTPTDNACGAGLKTDEDDSIFKVSLTYQFSDNTMVYATFSEGFRPPGLNREVGDLSDGTIVIPQAYDLDLVTNYEFGWKTTLADGRVRFNGAVYFMDWEDMQLTRFDPAVSLIGLTKNVPGADITGIEVDLDWLVTDDWRIRFSASNNEAELSSEFRREGTLPPAAPEAPDGTDLPFTPDLKYTIGTRYEFDVGNMGSYVQASYSYTDDSWNDLFIAVRQKQDSYGIVNAAVGIERESWGLELYGQNLTDEHADLFVSTRILSSGQVTTNRPRNYGLRFRHRFK